ncbi:RNA pseudouridylate synthase domain-containing 4 [Pelobates cultripes]|uniref:RNA pseudouridylate synthase domain-containing 4 n=1 Tax=Pelobates cultripes TaxID=61616 RepID=A0AAD1SRS6_PELCU|nr:RNA pseudouridylate synthase domain-containing 4 [Pelobates cultripes]
MAAPFRLTLIKMAAPFRLTLIKMAAPFCLTLIKMAAPFCLTLIKMAAVQKGAARVARSLAEEIRAKKIIKLPQTAPSVVNLRELRGRLVKEDPDLVLINKPHGLPVHGKTGTGMGACFPVGGVVEVKYCP